MFVRRRFAVVLALVMGIVVAASGAPREEASPQTGAGTTASAAAQSDERNRGEEGAELPIVAVFVKNHAGALLEGKVDAFADTLGSRLTEKGYRVISREDVLNAVAAFSEEGANAGDASRPGADLDKILSNNTSALRLAQNMGADYLLVATLVNVGQSKKTFDGYGVKTVVQTTKLRASYSMLDGSNGATVPGVGGTVEAVNQTRTDENAQETIDLPNDLLDDAASKLAEKAPVLTRKPRAAITTTLTINANIQGQTVPDIVRNEAGQYVVTSTWCPVRTMNASVELDGVIIGTASGKFQDVPKGLHKIRVTCKGSEDWSDYEGTVKIAGDVTLDIDLHLTDKGYAKWQEITTRLQAMKAGDKLTDAQVEVLKGQAQMLRQSGFRIDAKSDVKSDVKIDSDLKNLQSLWVW